MLTKIGVWGRKINIKLHLICKHLPVRISIDEHEGLSQDLHDFLNGNMDLTEFGYLFEHIAHYVYFLNRTEFKLN
jgi:hypothetical protein